MNLTRLLDNLDSINSLIDASFFIAEKGFHELDKGQVTTELKLITSIGSEIAIMKVIHDRIKSKVKLLEEMLLEEKVNAQENA